jgi:hypothetical protein
MGEKLVMKDVPPEKVDDLIQKHVKMGARKIEQTKQPDGKFSVTLVYEGDEALR